jgi:hypothetical protein
MLNKQDDSSRKIYSDSVNIPPDFTGRIILRILASALVTAYSPFCIVEVATALDSRVCCHFGDQERKPLLVLGPAPGDHIRERESATFLLSG